MTEKEFYGIGPTPGEFILVDVDEEWLTRAAEALAARLDELRSMPGNVDQWGSVLVDVLARAGLPERATKPLDTAEDELITAAKTWVGDSGRVSAQDVRAAATKVVGLERTAALAARVRMAGRRL